MSREHVRADAATCAAHCDVIVWQEIEETEDDEDIDASLPPAEWDHTYRSLEVPLSVRLSLFQRTPKSQLPAGILHNAGHLQISKGRAHVSPSRDLSWGIYSARGLDLPPVVFMDSHWVSGAWTHAGQLGDSDGWRLATWQENFDATKAQIEAFNAAGLTVVFGADTNTPAEHLPAFTADQITAVSDSGYDKIIVCPAVGGAVVEVLETGRFPLFSDHDLRTAKLRITS